MKRSELLKLSWIALKLALSPKSNQEGKVYVNGRYHVRHNDIYNVINLGMNISISRQELVQAKYPKFLISSKLHQLNSALYKRAMAELGMEMENG